MSSMNQIQKLRLPLILVAISAVCGAVLTNVDALYLAGTFGAAVFALLVPLAYVIPEYRGTIRTVMSLKVLAAFAAFFAIGSASAAILRSIYGSRENAVGDIGGVGSWMVATVGLLAFVVSSYMKVVDVKRINLAG